MPRSPSSFSRFLILAVAIFCASVFTTHAQSVRWEPAAGTLAREQISSLRLVFSDAEPDEIPVPPAVAELRIEPTPNRSEQSTFNVGFGTQPVRQRTITFSYRVIPTRLDGDIRIPAFNVETDAGPLTVPAATFTIGSATVGQSGLPLDQIATARFTPPAAPIWAGEVFRLTHTLDVDRRYATNSILAAPLQWTPTPLIAEDWSKPTGSEVTRNGQSRLLVTNDTLAIAPTGTNSLAIPAAIQLVNLPTGGASNFSLFGGPTFEQFSITSEATTLRIRPLPSPVPAGFTGAVGQFKLTGKAVPETVIVGEPVTWTLTLEGTGNWPLIDSLPARELSRDFRVVTPRAQKTPVGTGLFEASLSEDIVLIPQKPGRITLGPYALTVFNPSTGTYETLRTDSFVITIDPAVAFSAPGASTSGAPPTDTTAASTPPDASPPALPAPAGKLPSDPLPADTLAAEPWADWPRLLLWALPALFAPAALWLSLAAIHARRHDPLRPRRVAHAQLNKILARLETTTTASPDDLLAWQRASSTLFALDLATPAARDMPDPVWSALWIETERALYRRSTPLDPEWFRHARVALASATPPRSSALAAFRPAHLFPRAVSALLLAGLSAGSLFLTPSGQAATGAESYAAGDFPAATKAWRETVTAAPLAWPSRHNLALALAQQGQWDAATAHAYAATLQAPRATEPHRLLGVVQPKASFRAALPPAPALLLGPRNWQQLALAATFALLLTPLIYVLAAYRPAAARHLLTPLAHAIILISAVALVASLLALRAYGPAAAPEAVLVWRDATLRAVPTDAGDQKITADLPAGTVARTDKTFLGWRRLVLLDGTTGWVRAEPLVGLWRTP